MKQRILGATGMSVSEYALGAMMFGAYGNGDHDDSIKIIHRALDAGITFIDTADVYSNGESEQIVGKALKGRRDEVVLATKFGLPMSTTRPDRRGGSRRWIMRAVEDSLRRLDTDHIDLYQMHRMDHDTPVEETLAALSDLIRDGKVRAVGSSKFPAEAIVAAQWAAQRHGLHRFLAEQPMYSIFTRQLEGAVLPTARKYGMGVLTFGPLNGGWLSGRTDVRTGHRAASRPEMYDPDSRHGAEKARALTELTALAAEAGMTLPRLAIGFVLSHPAVTSVLIGPRTQEQLDTLLFEDADDGGNGLTLSEELLDRIDEIVPPGTDLDARDNYGDQPPALADKRLRRF
jgi:aryl-alcohol dehydrogenase-like predicted oxidoreductase